MVEAWTAAQMREAERPHLEAGEPLMHRAAEGLAAVVRDLLRASSGSIEDPTARVLLLVGSGNNGADTLYAGASLAQEFVPRGGVVTVVPVGSRVHQAALAAALSAGAVVDEIEDWCDPAIVRDRLPEYDVVLDGLVGTGSRGAGLRGDALRVVGAVLAGAGACAGAVGLTAGDVPSAASCASAAPRPASEARSPLVVAVDVPSGIGVDDGSMPDPPIVLPAGVTVTFGGHKVGLLVGPGSALAGRVVLVDIGIADDLARMPPAVVV